MKLSEVTEIEEKPGVYIVRWAKDSVPFQIGRLGDIDSKGILYIGSAKSLKKRIKRLWRGIKGRKPIHTAARSFIFTDNYSLIDLNDIEKITITFDTHGEAKTQEWSALKFYGNRFKELPPLNLIIGRKRKVKTGSTKVEIALNEKLKILLDC